MKKHILHTLYSLSCIGILWFCTACSEQDELPAANPQYLTFTIGGSLPFRETATDADDIVSRTADASDSSAHTRITDSGTTLSWENGDKVYFAAKITADGTATYAYATATYSSSGNTWGPLTLPITIPVNATVDVEALYAQGTASGNTITVANNGIVMKATATGITAPIPTAVQLTFQSALVRAEVTGIDDENPVRSSSISIPKSVDVQPADGSFSITPATASITSNAVYYILPGALTLKTANEKSFNLTGMKANSSYLLDTGRKGGNITPDGNEITQVVTLALGDYADASGTVSRIVLNGTSSTVTHGTGHTYVLNNITEIPDDITSLDIYVYDNLINSSQLLLSATPYLLTLKHLHKTIIVPLNAGGMEGEGSASVPYQVTTPVQLRGVAQAPGGHYQQTKNLNLQPYANWTPTDFSGVYDGNNKAISNLKISSGGSGLFGRNQGTIKNLHVGSGTIKGAGSLGGICSTISGTNAVVENCSNAATIEGTDDNGAGSYIGGICGQVESSCIVRHCKNTGTITGKAELIGGIVGWVSSGTASYCYNEGTVAPTKPYHPGKSAGYGGIAGGIYYGNAAISYCYNNGTVIPNSWEGDGRGTAKRGEIVGWSDSGNGVQHNWYRMGDTPVGDNGVNASDNHQFGNGNPIWPEYSTDASNGWGSSHWKSFSNGSYPELLWE